MSVAMFSKIITIGLVVHLSLASVGPYVLRLINGGECEDVESTIFDPDMYVSREGDNEPALYGTLQVSEEAPNITARVTSCEWGNGGWQKHAITYNVKNWCGGKVYEIFRSALNITFGENCSIPPGNYAINRLDVNDFLHQSVGNILKYGRYKGRFVLLSQKNEIQLCYEVECEISRAPMKAKNRIGVRK